MLRLLSYYFWPIVGSAVVLITLLAIWVGRLISAARKASDDEPAEPEAEGKVEPEDFSPHDPQLRASFLKGLDQLRGQTSGKGDAYRIPWFVLAGQVGSRPSDLLANAGLSFALPRPDAEDLSSELGVRWWFCDRGVVLDLAGEYVQRGDGESSDESGWRSFLRLLQRHRPERPLDGLVLTLSASDLLAAAHEGSQGAIDLEQKATSLARKLWDLQKTLGIRCPIYVTVTGCEAIRGFSAFARALPDEARRGMFGWSSPYSVDTVYRSEWVDEVFDDVQTHLERAQLKAFAQNADLEQADEVFVFSTEIARLRSSVQTYLNQVFRAAYHESMLLRGVYFTGAAEPDPAEAPVQAEGEPFPVEMPDFMEGGLTRAYHFVRDLFDKKIFVEANLARPTGASLLQKNRRVRFAQAALAATVGILALGLWFGHRHLSAREEVLRPFLDNTYELVADARKNLDLYGADERLALNRSATRFLSELTTLDGSRFDSLFIPRSWLPDFDDKLGASFVRAYDIVVFQAMRQELDHRADEIVSLRQFEPDSGIGLGLVLPADRSLSLTRPIEDMSSFGALERYLETINEFEEHVELYNGIGSSRSLDDLGTLVEYLFGEPLPEGFFKSAAVYEEALERVDYKEFEFGPYRETARRRARQLVDDFYRALFEANPFVTNVELLSLELANLSLERWTTFDETSRLQAIVDVIDRVDRALSEPSLFWAFRNRFDLGPEFTRIKALVDSSQLLRSDFVEASLTREVQEHGEARWRLLKRNLSEYGGSGLTGPFFKRNQDGLAMQLSPDVEVLRTSLEGFLSESFMAAANGGGRTQLATDVDFGRNRLRWDNNLLTFAVGVYDPYQRFMTTGLTYFPPHLQSTLKIVAQKRLNQTLVDLVQRSRILEPVPEGLTSSLRARELKEEIGRFRESAPTLTRLLAILQEAQLWDLERSLSDLVAAQSYELLAAVDQTLRAEPLYRPKGGNFDWWDVNSPLAFDAYAASDSEELRAYLARQRARMSVLANEMAQPVVSMLANVGNDEHRDLLLKWDAILTELDGYEEKQPGNSLAALEELIAAELTQVGLDNCFETARPFTQASTTGDFFRDQDYNLRDHVYQRCFAVVGQRAAQGYEQIRRFFNQRLAGKFPFAAAVNDIFPVEVDPETLKEFFRLFEAEKDIILGVPAQSPAFRNAGGEVHQFIRDLDSIRAFLSPFLAEVEPGSLPVVDCEIEFRVNRQAEQDGDQIIEWRLDVGERQLVHPDPDPIVRWTLGDPMRLTLRWANGSPWRPSDAQPMPRALVQNETVVYDYRNKWSLVSFLQNHPSVPTDFFGLEDERPHTLKFQLETIAKAPSRRPEAGPESAEAKVFIRVSLIAADTKEPLLLPEFPEAAPALGEQLASR